MRVTGQQRGRLWVRLVLIAAFLAVTAYVVGVKPVFIWTEVACPAGHVERAVTIQDGIYWCVPPGGSTGLDLENRPMGGRQRWIGLYLANLQVRLFEYDNGSYRWLARDVAPPP